MIEELHFSIDIETNGDIPGYSSMLSLGCAAIDLTEERVISTFQCNLERLPNDHQTAGNKAFWNKFYNQYQATRVNTVPPVVGMRNFRDWVRDLCNGRLWFDEKKNDYVAAKPVAVAYPAAWDFGWVYWYLNYFLGEDASPFKHRALDIRTLISKVLGIPYNDAHISKVPKEWMPEERQARADLIDTNKGDRSYGAEHNALKDALEQGMMFIALEREWKKICQSSGIIQSASLTS